MRCFIAIELPKEFDSDFLELQRNIKKYGKMSMPKSFHLTLKFLGEINEKELEKVKEALSKINFKSFDITTGALGAFPSEEYIRVIWIGLEPEGRILELQKNIENATSGIGFSKERDFKAHVTLARVKYIDPIKKTQLAGLLKSSVIEQRKFKATSVRLIKSTLTTEGPVYETIDEYILKG